MFFDAHVHTPFCPHGSTDPLEAYVEKAIENGYKGISFTEHAPLPIGFTDPVPEQDSALRLEKLPDYLKAVDELKKNYQGTIDIRTGLEVDFIEGFERSTRTFLNQWGQYLDDAILSVHFLKSTNDRYICLDYNHESFQQLVDDFGSVEAVYEKYFETVRKSIRTDLGKYKPKRIGHLTLVRKFHRRFPVMDSAMQGAFDLLPIISEFNMEIDANGAGVNKKDCLEPYPPLEVIRQANDLKIPIVYGSDAHVASAIAQKPNALFEIDGLDFSKPEPYST
ncbi:histidinol-phosphatase HisJ [Texcoconibacillus texcoconensis]|uniref:Histidinol-phosphatase n=1 Tax=Texcoconibacillus texcoconensis TaxID=1095777 RepID=A0A840QN50_9BACI|nr:histidinol-phosphatase HisJ [Texcoconibacillus texcoconensis]MBB5172761.1 histidinol-phosphatase (PHP family) [Texcoconibacillus texcoconensis]